MERYAPGSVEMFLKLARRVGDPSPALASGDGGAAAEFKICFFFFGLGRKRDNLARFIVSVKSNHNNVSLVHKIARAVTVFNIRLNTSLEVCVKSYIEHSDGARDLMNEAYVVMVALDGNDKPCKVIPLAPQTEEEKTNFELGRRRASERKQRRERNAPPIPERV